MDYEKSIPFSGDIEKALDVAIGILLPNGFSIIHKDDKSIELVGSLNWMRKGQAPIEGVSNIIISGYGNELSVKADFGGIRTLTKFLVIFMSAMAVSTVVFCGVLLHQKMETERWIFISLAPYAPWLVIGPLMAKFMKPKAVKAVDSILNNMVALSKG